MTNLIPTTKQYSGHGSLAFILHYRVKFEWECYNLLLLFSMSKTFPRSNTSKCPLKDAWCRLVRPALSVTLTVDKDGIKVFAMSNVSLAAATWRGVCQFLSLALTSALCFSRTFTVFYNKKKIYTDMLYSQPADLIKQVHFQKIQVYRWGTANACCRQETYVRLQNLSQV